MYLVDELETALLKLQNLSLRQEMDSFDRDMFVDNHQVAQLETSDWQVVFGRRGTGKTTLLYAFKDHVASTNANAHCILIDMRECIPSASGLTRQAETDLDFSVDYFYEFICRFARRLFEECLDTRRTSPFGRLVRSLGLRQRERVDEVLLKIIDLAEYQPRYRRGQAATVKTTSTDTAQAEAGAGIGIGGQAVALKPPELSIDAKRVRGTGREDVVEETFIYEAAKRYQPLRREIERLLDAIDAGRLYILIDEWADLNRVRDDNVQPIFAELLRKTFAGMPKVSVKIASIKGATRFDIWRPQGGVGLELGADLFEACDLDKVYASAENSVDFFQELLFKRMCKVYPRLADLSAGNGNGVRSLKPPKRFFDRYFFKDPASFTDIVKGAGEIPRDFEDLFLYCAREMGFSIRTPWPRGEILKLITKHSIQNRNDSLAGGQSRGELFYRIVDATKKNESRMFLVDHGLSERAKDVVSDLYHARLIHSVNPAVIPLKIRSQYDCYKADLGYFLDAALETKHAALQFREIPFAATMDDDDIERFVIPVEDLVAAWIRCPHCERPFLDTERSYVARSLCPHCFDDIEEADPQQAP